MSKDNNRAIKKVTIYDSIGVIKNVVDLSIKWLCE